MTTLNSALMLLLGLVLGVMLASTLPRAWAYVTDRPVSPWPAHDGLSLFDTEPGSLPIRLALDPCDRRRP